MIEDQLREQLRRVDDLTPPPAPDFAARAMGDSARRSESPRAWGKLLLGAAAAVVVGTLAITNLSHLSTSGSATSGAARAAAGVAAPEGAADGATPPTLKTATGPDTVSSLPGPSSTATGRLFTAAQCASTLTMVRAAVPALQRQGLPIVGTACDPRGVVVLRVGLALSPAQRGVLTARYGARVSVAGRDGTPLP